MEPTYTLLFMLNMGHGTHQYFWGNVERKESSAEWSTGVAPASPYTDLCQLVPGVDPHSMHLCACRLVQHASSHLMALVVRTGRCECRLGQRTRDKESLMDESEMNQKLQQMRRVKSREPKPPGKWDEWRHRGK